MDLSAIPCFTYDETDVRVDDKKCAQLDEMLSRGWNDAMIAGLFRHGLDKVQCKLTCGSKRYIKKLNKDRILTRRSPPKITTLSQPFDESKFNFTKVKSQEILVRLYDKGEVEQHIDLMIINVSPMIDGHMLIVPDVFSSLPQVLTERAVKLAVRNLLLTNDRSWRIGFNSLCAYASVNHLHLHRYAVYHDLYIEQLRGTQISRGLYQLDGSPIPAFALELDRDSNLLCRRCVVITEYLHEHNIAHSLAMTWALPLGETAEARRLRIIIWPRRSIIDQNHSDPVSIACAELSGVFIMSDERSFERLTEEDLEHYMKKEALPAETIATITSDLIKVWTEI